MRHFLFQAAMAAVFCAGVTGGFAGCAWDQPTCESDSDCPDKATCGNDGTCLLKGDRGEAGSDGRNGAQGAPGEDGADGATGPAGPAGPAGSQGSQGEPGTPGEPGAPGQDGADGAQGSQGEPGADGADGAPGGEQGPEGPAGEDGQDGADGADGAQGPEGPEGPQGPQGPAAEGEGEGEGAESAPECDEQSQCDDGNACTVDVCNVRGQCENRAVNCDDGVDCTHDECVPASGCKNTTDDSACGNGEHCFAYSQEEKHWANVMDGCFECQNPWGGAGESQDCDDQNPCTADICTADRTCQHEPFCGEGQPCVAQDNRDRFGPAVECGEDNDGDGFFNPDTDARLVDCNDRNPDSHPGAAEICDYEDNNCNGEVDEHFQTGGACNVGVGECRRDGVMLCQLDGTNACANPNTGRPIVAGAAVAEICRDAKDNDCDGVADEVDACPVAECQAGATRVCGNPAVGQCRQGQQTCGNDSRWVACTGEVRPVAEACNALDDDCDGVADDGLNCPAPQPNGGTDQIRECAPADPVGNWGISIMGVPNAVVEQATAAGQCVQMDTLTANRSNLRFNARRPNQGLYCCGTVAGSNVPQDLCPGLQVFRDGVQVAHGSGANQLQCVNDANGNNYRINP